MEFELMLRKRVRVCWCVVQIGPTVVVNCCVGRSGLVTSGVSLTWMLIQSHENNVAGYVVYLMVPSMYMLQKHMETKGGK